MPEINPMDLDLPFVNSNGDGINIKSDGTLPEVLAANVKTGTLRDEPYDVGKWTVSEGSGITITTDCVVGSITFNYHRHGNSVHMWAAFSVELPFSGSAGDPSFSITLPVDGDFPSSASATGIIYQNKFSGTQDGVKGYCEANSFLGTGNSIQFTLTGFVDRPESQISQDVSVNLSYTDLLGY